MRVPSAWVVSFLVLGLGCPEEAVPSQPAPAPERGAASERERAPAEPAQPKPEVVWGTPEPAEPEPPEPEPESEPRASAGRHESVIRVQHRERLGAVANEGDPWSVAERRRKAREICRLHFPEDRGCPAGVIHLHANEALEVYQTVSVSLRVTSGESHRQARAQAVSLARGAGPLLSVDGLDVSWLTELDGSEWSGQLRELVAELRGGAEEGVGVGPFECALRVVTQEPGVAETFERDLVGRSESAYADACLDAVRGICESPRCSVRIVHFDHLPFHDHRPRGPQLIPGFPG